MVQVRCWKNIFYYRTLPSSWYMNITIANHNIPNKAKYQSNGMDSSIPYQQPPSIIRKPQQNHQIGKIDCASGLFGNCVDSAQIEGSQKNEVYQFRGRIEQFQGHYQSRLIAEDGKNTESRRHKLSVSLKKSKVEVQIVKKHQSSQKSIRRLSGSKKYKTEQAMQEQSCSQQKTPQKIKVQKLKTQPKRDHLHQFVNVHQMKQSLKPSTNISSVKKSTDSTKKPKLTLASNFKSQIQQINNCISQFKPNYVPYSRNTIDKGISSQQVMVEQSFMTAKLVNIYGDINHSDDLYVPSSNIVYYNKLMTCDKQWKTPSKKDSAPEVEKYRSPEDSINLEQQSGKEIANKRDISIQRQIEEQDNNDSQNQIQGKKESQKNKSKFINKKGIGEYAHTIKTFNQSDFRSMDEESIVLQHNTPVEGGGTYMNFLPLNRGSIKNCGTEEQIDQICTRRAYGSFGDERSLTVVMGKDRQKCYVNQTIQQDLNDEQKQF